MTVKLTPLRKRTARRRSAGFTLVELLLVLVILAALAYLTAETIPGDHGNW